MKRHSGQFPGNRKGKIEHQLYNWCLVADRHLGEKALNKSYQLQRSWQVLLKRNIFMEIPKTVRSLIGSMVLAGSCKGCEVTVLCICS